MRNNPKLDLVIINAYAKFGPIPSISSQGISGNGSQTLIKGHNSIMVVKIDV